MKKVKTCKFKNEEIWLEFNSTCDRDKARKALEGARIVSFGEYHLICKSDVET